MKILFNYLIAVLTFPITLTWHLVTLVPSLAASAIYDLHMSLSFRKENVHLSLKILEIPYLGYRMAKKLMLKSNKEPK